jgi:hypothetical protein
MPASKYNKMQSNATSQLSLPVFILNFVRLGNRVPAAKNIAILTVIVQSASPPPARGFAGLG